VSQRVATFAISQSVPLLQALALRSKPLKTTMSSTSTAAAASSGGSKSSSSSSSQQQPSTSTTSITIPSNLSHLAPLTKNEVLLLSTYEQIKQYEKISSKLKANEAKRRLEEADERYRGKVRERERAENGGDDDGEGGEGGEGVGKYAHDASENSADDVDDPIATSAAAADKARLIEKQKQRQMEISQLRADIEAKQLKDKELTAQREKEEIMRRELLGPDELKKKKKKRPRDDDDGGVEDQDDAAENDNNEGEDNDDEMEDESSFLQQSKTIISGPSIKKKRIEDNTTTTSSWDNNNATTNTGTSLIANMSAGVTPPHDFSKDLKMSKTSLDGSILFPNHTVFSSSDEKMWIPPSNPINFMDGCLELELPNFDPTGSSSSGGGNNNNNNTLAIKFHAPQESSRFSINMQQQHSRGNQDNTDEQYMTINRFIPKVESNPITSSSYCVV